MSTFALRLAGFYLLAGLLLLSGCSSRGPGRSMLGTTFGTREVKASVDGPGFISSQGEAAVISFKGGKLIVEKEKVLLNGKELAKVPANAAKVEIDFTAGTLTVTADGAKLYAEPLPK